jgi:hypothetical protein
MADLRDRARRTRLAPHFEAPMLRQVIRRTTFDQDDIADAILMGRTRGTCFR